MASKRNEKPAGRGVKDKEVLSAEHDDLLTWAINHLKNLVADRWGLDSAELAQALAQARSSAVAWLDKFYSELAQFESGKRTVFKTGEVFTGEEQPIGVETKASIGLATQRKSSVEHGIAACNPTDTAGDAVLETFTVMKPVCKVEPRQYSEAKRTPAGFVDLVAEMFVPMGLEISVEGVPRKSQPHEYTLFSNHYTCDESVRTKADALVKDGVKLTVTGQSATIWISVRSDPFTLGQVLQELKALQQLEDERQRVVLLVNHIDQRMRTNIEHEGFTVIARDDYPESA